MGSCECASVQNTGRDCTIAVRLRPRERHPVCREVVQRVRRILQIRAKVAAAEI